MGFEGMKNEWNGLELEGMKNDLLRNRQFIWQTRERAPALQASAHDATTPGVRHCVGWRELSPYGFRRIQ